MSLHSAARTAGVCRKRPISPRRGVHKFLPSTNGSEAPTSISCGSWKSRRARGLPMRRWTKIFLTMTYRGATLPVTGADGRLGDARSDAMDHLCG